MVFLNAELTKSWGMVILTETVESWFLSIDDWMVWKLESFLLITDT
jgi:hypothetical protein